MLLWEDFVNAVAANDPKKDEAWLNQNGYTKAKWNQSAIPTENDNTLPTETDNTFYKVPMQVVDANLDNIKNAPSDATVKKLAKQIGGATQNYFDNNEAMAINWAESVIRRKLKERNLSPVPSIYPIADKLVQEQNDLVFGVQSEAKIKAAAKKIGNKVKWEFGGDVEKATAYADWMYRQMLRERNLLPK